MTPPKAWLFAILGLSCFCTTAGKAVSTGPYEMQGGLAARPIDGQYRGESQRVAGDDVSCRPGRDVAVDVRGGRVHLPWQGPQMFDATIQPDGGFFATTGSFVRAEKYLTLMPTLQGHIDAAGLVADYGTRWCRYRLSASQTPAQPHMADRAHGGRAQQ